MTDHPILFSAPMVRALLDGRKTQTRRILKPQPYPLEGMPGYWNASGAVGGRIVTSAEDLARLHRFAKGDRLWVRETLKRDDGSWIYAADGLGVGLPQDDPRIPHMVAWAHHKEGDTCVSIHMPRWASRLTLTVTDVRVQRLQAITPADCIAEGAFRPTATPMTVDCETRDPRDDFAALWRSINGRDSWDANPWVTATTFTVERRNIDA